MWSPVVVRKNGADASLHEIFAGPLSPVFWARHLRQNRRGREVYSLHAHEVECIGRGQGPSLHEFGVKVSVATALARSKGGHVIAHVKTLPAPYDGHPLKTVIPEIRTQIGASLVRIVVDRDCRGHNAPPDHKIRVYFSGQKQGVTHAIKRDLRRRSASEPATAPAATSSRERTATSPMRCSPAPATFRTLPPKFAFFNF